MRCSARPSRFGCNRRVSWPPSLSYIGSLAAIARMKLNRSFWGVLVGAVLCFSGIAGISYFLFFPEEWSGSDFWRWMPVSLIGVCVGGLLIAASFLTGVISSLIGRFRHRHEKDVP